MGREIRGWAAPFIAVSFLLLVATFSSYALAGRGSLSLALFWLGLGGEFNVGSWWSGMLFMLPAIFCLAQACIEQSRIRRAWMAFAILLALFSFDEMAMLHEYLSARDRLLLLPPGLVGIGLVLYGLVGFSHNGHSVRKWLIAFALLATVPLQEHLQHAIDWPDPTVYGVRAFVEEGTEIAAALLFVFVASRGLASMRPLIAPLLRRSRLTVTVVGCAVALAVVAALALDLPGIVTWAGATLFLLCALLSAANHTMWSSAWRPAGLYLLASLGMHAVRAEWDPAVFGHLINLRAVFFAGWLSAAAWWLSTMRSHETGWLVLAACALVAGIEVPSLTPLWMVGPVGLSLLCFRMELESARRGALPAGGGGAWLGADPGGAETRAR